MITILIIILVFVFYALVAAVVAAFLNRNVGEPTGYYYDDDFSEREANAMTAVLWPVVLPFVLFHYIFIWPFYKLYLWLVDKWA